MKRKLSAVLITSALLSSAVAQAETADLQKLIAAETGAADHRLRLDRENRAAGQSL
ncbi:hypothetical protein LO739_07840 [Leclercia adecarboxylata]|uniref:hypothetical protein n=1 Tax=Leclercia adecarboxylata TaxID=83655 RepID=UPI001E47F8DC|nr:hypothetical protein [Leclercia adecarboxylata]UFM71086.1 hypothetical protein LO739_07840 [Leclercia adecarboxylata]